MCCCCFFLPFLLLFWIRHTFLLRFVIVQDEISTNEKRKNKVKFEAVENKYTCKKMKKKKTNGNWIRCNRPWSSVIFGRFLGIIPNSFIPWFHFRYVVLNHCTQDPATILSKLITNIKKSSSQKWIREENWFIWKEKNYDDRYDETWWCISASMKF